MSETRQPLERDGSGVYTLTLRQEGRSVVVLDWDLLRSIDRTLDDVVEANGFVLASDSKVFVAGANLQEIMGLTDAELHEYLEFGSAVFAKIAALPCTSVAAIHGAAMGGGLEIAMHCDHLVAVVVGEGSGGRDYPVGLPEAGLSICPGWGGTNMLPARIDAGKAIEMTATGKPGTSASMDELGLFAGVVDSKDALLDAARRVALGEKDKEAGRARCISDAGKVQGARAGLDAVRGSLPDTQAARAVAGCVAEGLDKGWEAALAMERRELVRLRSTEEGRGAIEAFFAKTRAKSGK